MMKIIDTTCPSCGATMKVNNQLKIVNCNYCGKELMLMDDVQKHEIANGYQLGYEQEMGRQQALKDIKEKEVNELANNKMNTDEIPLSQALIVGAISVCIGVVAALFISKLIGAVIGFMLLAGLIKMSRRG